MSRTRNQRRRALWRRIERIILAALIAILVWAIFALGKQVREIEEMQRARREQVSIVTARDFLPEGFDPSCPEYQAALQRYAIENGLLLPGEKETAPERASSEAADARDIAS